MNKKQIDTLWRKWKKFVYFNTQSTCKSFCLALIKAGANPFAIKLARDIDYVEFVAAFNYSDILTVEEPNNKEEQTNGNV